jgi:hypothetical protein
MRASRRRSCERASKPWKSATRKRSFNRPVPPLRSFAVFFGGPPDLLFIGEGGEAGHDRLSGTAQDDDTRIAEQVQMVALWQARSKVVAYRS